MRLNGDAPLLSAHGLGGREDIPAPTWLALYAAAVVVLITFFALAALWSSPRLRGREAGRPIPGLTRFSGLPLTDVALRVLGLILLGGFLLVAWGGPDDNGRGNPAPTWIYVYFWVGLVPLSLVGGAVWSRINPLRTLAGLLRRVAPPGELSIPPRLGYWPAAASLVAFTWMELVYDHAASPRVVATFVTLYCAVHVAIGYLVGTRWFACGEGFEVYATMVARLSPLGRRNDGVLVLRNPLDGLAGTPAFPDLTPVVFAVLGSTAFDGLTRTDFWARVSDVNSRMEYLALGTLGLAAGLLLMSGTYLIAVRLTERLVGEPHLGIRFAPTIIPIAIGYTVAHYFSFAVFQGQQGVLLANDPFVRGDDWLGLAGRHVNYNLIPSSGIAWVQISAIVVGHVIAVVASHDRAVELLPAARSKSGQYPVLVLMVLYTVTGIALVSGAG
jgi:hypothetical protein